MTYKIQKIIISTYEEIFENYEIYIVSNQDRWRGGFEWSVCKDNCEIESELAFCIEDAIKNARDAVTNLIESRAM